MSVVYWSCVVAVVVAAAVVVDSSSCCITLITHALLKTRRYMQRVVYQDIVAQF
jgi:hypothetical protein